MSFAISKGTCSVSYAKADLDGKYQETNNLLEATGVNIYSMYKCRIHVPKLVEVGCISLQYSVLSTQHEQMLLHEYMILLFPTSRSLNVEPGYGAWEQADGTFSHPPALWHSTVIVPQPRCSKAAVAAAWTWPVGPAPRQSGPGSHKTGKSDPCMGNVKRIGRWESQETLTAIISSRKRTSSG